jgi:Na+/melibiose symporter-like transporter
MVVNIGSFTGKTIVAPIRIDMGVENVPWFSSAASFVALLLVLAIFRPPSRDDVRPRNVRETLEGMWMAMSNMRFLFLILITAGFWAIQGQLYAAMPDYVLRMAGETYKPEWYANVNPLVVVLFVVAVTQWTRRWKPQNSILIALGLIPFSALSMALSASFDGPIGLFGMALHPITVMMVLGISIQGISECFLSPKYLEFASIQAPDGKEGVFLGFAHMNTFFAWLFSFVLSGYLLEAYCPAPHTLAPEMQAAHAAWLAGAGPIPEAYAHAHYLWYAYTGIGVASFVLMVVYVAVTNRLDRRSEASG